MASRGAALEAARRWWPLAAGVVLGLVVGLLVSLLQSGTRRAEASVLISSPAGPPAVRPMLPNLRELATSGVVAGNVHSTLRLSESTETLRRHLHATVRPASEVIAVSATDDVADHARQLAQEAAVVFSQLVESRFGTGSPELHAAVLDSAHVLGGPDRHYARNLLIGALVGLVLGSAAAFALASRAPQPVAVPADDSELKRREQLLEQRLAGVSQRERALAVHAGKLSARERELEDRVAKLEATERDLGDRAAKLEATERDLEDRAAKLEATERDLEDRAAKLEGTERDLAAQPVEPPAPVPAVAPPPPSPHPAPEPRRVSGSEPLTPAKEPVRVGAWNLRELESLAAAETGASPEQLDEWRAYLFFLREHATHDGALPRSFDGLISDVFAGLVDRHRGS